MRNYLTKSFFVLAIVALYGLTVFGQVATTGSISGTVSDATGAVIPNATVTAKNTATGAEKSATTNDNGSFTIPQVPSGMYVVTVEATKGFKKAQITNVKVDVGTPATVNAVLEVGTAQETVTIVGGGEVIQTQTATIGTTLTGRQITDIPTASRDALDLVLALPGTTTVGRPRQSSVNGLPKGALNITLDGINVQDNLLKSSDGFFTYIRPRTDAISEVTTSNSNPGAESSGEGAFQIKFVTQGGGNKYHGGGYWYYRTPGLNSNYWFNNRDLPPDPVTGKAPRTPIILNQPGFKVGGPITIPKLFNGKDKAFFFFNYEEFRLPESTLRTRNILTTQAQSGLYRFFTASTPSASWLNTTCVTAPAGSPAANLCTTDIFARAAAVGLTFANTDPTIGALLGSIRSSLSSAVIKDTGDPNIQQTTFINHGFQLRRFPTARLDFNLTKKHHLENIWNWQKFGSTVDFLNSRDPQFPGFPNHGSQQSVRFSNSSAWRWTISNNLVNEARYGIVGGTVLFFSEVNAGQFTNQSPNGQPINLPLSNFSSGGFGLTNPTNTTAPSRRNAPVNEFADNLNWIKGQHSLTFGASRTQIDYWAQNQTVVPSASFAISTSLDAAPVNAFGSLPSTTFRNGAAQLYGVLSGRMTAFNGNVRLDENTGNYSYLGSLINRARSTEWGIFGQDQWRARPNVTLTLGLRYEQQNAIQAKNISYSQVTYADLFGESGVGHLFSPGTLTGQPSTYTSALNIPVYKRVGLFLPSFGFTYSPNFKSGLLRRLGGGSGQTVFRGGFSMASVREGTNVFDNVTGSNPGGFVTANRNLTLGNLPVGTYLRQAPFAPPLDCTSPGVPVGCKPTTLIYPNNGLLTDSVNAFDPNLKIGYVESWSFGIQRELKKDNVIEVRYVANRGHKLWRQIDLNELNVIENGVGAEFALAQQNLLANIAANRCQTGLNPTTNPGCQINFAYFGPGTGTFPLPISLAYFSSLPGTSAFGNPSVAANYTSALFRDGSYTANLIPLAPSPTGFGGLLNGTGFDDRRTVLGQPCYGLTTHTNSSGGTSAGCTGLGLFPYNMFLVNAGKRGDPFLVNNSAQSWYDAITVEFRRRLAKGMLVQSSYTFGKTLSNTYASSSSVFDQPNTLRNLWTRKGVTPFDIRQSFKANFIYELPLGKGKTFFSGASGLLDKLVGGFAFNGNIRIQSGNPINFGNVQLVGMTAKELEDSVSVYKASDGFVYVLPQDIRDNTVKAFNVGYVVTQLNSTTPSVATISYTNGAPSGRFVAPASYGNCMQSFSGQCGFTNLIIHGPRFTRFDLSLAKKIRFSENINLEMRMEFLNAFNNINFLLGSAGNDINSFSNFGSSAFGRMTAAYQDLSTTNDPGGRVGQIVVRLNF